MELLICCSSSSEIKLAIDFSIAGSGQLFTTTQPEQSSAVERWSNPFWEVFILPLFNEEHEKGMVVSLTYNFHASVRLCQCCQARNYCPLLIMNRV